MKPAWPAAASRLIRWSFRGLVLFVALACSSTPPGPPEPAWIHQPTRTVDAGYIVYVGTGLDPSLEAARFKAEAAALEDLANECSFAPKGTRTEDRFEEPQEGEQRAYAKVALRFEECEQAKKAIQPEEVRALANPTLAAEIQKYQSWIGEPPALAASPQPPAGQPEGASAQPTPIATYSTAGYFMARQQVYYAKQMVILSPPTAYVAGSAETHQYLTQVTPTVARLRGYEAEHPAFKTWSHGWSHFTPRAGERPMSRPSGFHGGRHHGFGGRGRR